MSQTLDLGAMIALIQQRVPIGLGTQYITDRLNESFRWIEQQAGFIWDLRRVTRAVDQAGAFFTFPSNPDPGKPIAVYPDTGTTLKNVIPQIPFEEFAAQLQFNSPPPNGVFSTWTLDFTGTEYVGRLAPNTALASPVNIVLWYHTMVVPVTNTNDFYPSPDEFDSMIVDLTEAEVKRVYNIGGFETAQKKAEDQVMKIVDRYRSSKMFTEGLSEAAMDAQEAQAKRAQ